MEKMAVANQHSARFGANEISTVWTPSRDGAIDVPCFGCGVLDGHVSTKCQVWKWVCMLVIEGLSFLKDIFSMLGIDRTLLLRSEGPSVCREGNLDWVSVQLLCRRHTVSPAWRVPIL